jgi:hypothetical protein
MLPHLINNVLLFRAPIKAILFILRPIEDKNCHCGFLVPERLEEPGLDVPNLVLGGASAR